MNDNTCQANLAPGISAEAVLRLRKSRADLAMTQISAQAVLRLRQSRADLAKAQTAAGAREARQWAESVHCDYFHLCRVAAIDMTTITDVTAARVALMQAVDGPGPVSEEPYTLSFIDGFVEECAKIADAVDSDAH